METVYLLHHSYEDESHEDTKLIGVFSSEVEAQSTIRELRQKPGFREYPNGFEVHGYIIGRVSWLEGFGGQDDAS